MKALNPAVDGTQVWLREGKKERLVGILDIGNPNIRQMPNLTLVDLPQAMTGSHDTINTFDVPLSGRQVGVSLEALYSSRRPTLDLLMDAGAPAYATVQEDLTHGVICARWRVAEVDVDLYERLFDLEQFVPV
jgi:hypothetical protein